ncbi:acyl-coa n-acyltransferase [Trichococcus palustris]|uniref:Acyl-coa n-acyltransferase n=1 Tax=Trichococcus palustris TaxID=140314 RepID=A0A143Y9K4_9LACT|nr:acyl-coa n-acyltransferase [Trichococcus palustris]SFK69931.1 riboflavin biosynthesis RibT protein [Trichococcus palustris]
MFISYNQSCEKIAMGLLSYVTDLKNVARLKAEMDSYKENAERKLFLWKDEETDNIVALVGIELSDTMILVRHLAVSPSFRKEGIVYSLLNGLQKQYPAHSISGTIETAQFIAKWSQKQKEENDEGMSG